MENKLKSVNATEILSNIYDAVEDKNPLLDVMVAVFDENDLSKEERLAICSEALISLDKRIYFGSVVREVQSRALKDFGFSSAVPIIENLILSYLAKNFSILLNKILLNK